MTVPVNISIDWQRLVSGFLALEPKKPLIVIIGPTASGKTAFSLLLSLWLQGRGITPEIINADSRQFYRSLDIGTAKIPASDMRGIPHHLLSVLEPEEPCSIAWFQKLATPIIERLQRPCSVPLLVGGSMLYVSTIVDGLEPLLVDGALRTRLSTSYDADGGTSLHRELASLDPEAASSIPRENRVYLIRAMEIVSSSGVKKSQTQKHHACPYDLLILGLSIDRTVLKERLIERTKEMFASGWIDEVRSLLGHGYDETSPAMESHGYREIACALRAGVDPTFLQEVIVTKAMQYAKRHQTWWKRDSRVHWIQATAIS